MRRDWSRSPSDKGYEVWEQVYYALLDLLAPLGRDQSIDAYDCDYLIVDDDYSTYEQKICITKPDFPVDLAIAGMQRLLAERFDNWRIFVVFSDESGREGRLVYPDRVLTESETGPDP